MIMPKPKYTQKQVNLVHALMNEFAYRKHIQPDTEFKEVLERVTELLAADMINECLVKDLKIRDPK